MRVDWAGWALFGLLATTTIAIMIVAQMAKAWPTGSRTPCQDLRSTGTSLRRWAGHD